MHESEADGFAQRIIRGGLQGHSAAIREGECAFPAFKKIDDNPVRISGGGDHRQEGDAARATGETAVAGEVGREGLTVVLQFHIIAPAGTVGMLGPEQLVVAGALEFVGKDRFTCDAQQMGVELQPGDGDTGFRDVLQGVGQLVRGVEIFMLAAGARDIQALGHDVLPSMPDRLQYLPVASDAVELERAVEAGHHLVGLGVADLMDTAAGGEVGNEARPARAVPAPQHHLAELKVADLSCEPIHPHHGLQYAAGGHAGMGTAQHEIQLSGLLAEGPGQQVGDTHTGRHGRRIAGVAVIGEQSDQVVFVRPDIPGGPPLLGQISAEVAIGALGLEEPGGDPIELGAEGRIAGVDPCEGGGVEPFAHMLAIPLVHPRAVAIADQEAILIDDEQAVLLVRHDATSEKAGEADLVRLKQVLLIRNLGRDRERPRRRAEGQRINRPKQQGAGRKKPAKGINHDSKRRAAGLCRLARTNFGTLQRRKTSRRSS